MSNSENPSVQDGGLDKMDNSDSSKDSSKDSSLVSEQTKNYEERRTAYYTHLLNMWGQSVFEVEKAVMALSGGAIALLIAISIPNPSLINISLYFLSLSAFVFSLIQTFLVLKKHEPLALAAVSSFHTGNDAHESKETILLKDSVTRLQNRALISFFIGTFFASLLAIGIRLPNEGFKFLSQNEGAKMAKDMTPEEILAKIKSGELKLTLEQFQNIQKLAPVNPTGNANVVAAQSNNTSGNNNPLAPKKPNN